jgi:uncharacterized membrane protein YphA (DoxX/SURF4 family)
MSSSNVIVVNPPSPIRRSRVGLIALWGLQAALAALFLVAGGSKLAAAPAMVALYDAIAAGQWFRYVTGAIEVATAVALVIPPFAPFAALLLASTMVGAIATHLLVIGGSPAGPGILLVGLVVVAWARRGRVVDALSRLRKERSQ